jgi:hypothetical protein
MTHLNQLIADEHRRDLIRAASKLSARPSGTPRRWLRRSPAATPAAPPPDLNRWTPSRGLLPARLVLSRCQTEPRQELD